MGYTRRVLVVMAVGFLSAMATVGQVSTPSDKAEALSDAAHKGDAAGVKKLLDDGVDVNTKYRYDRTALSFACDRGHLEVVKVLLERGADVNVKDTFYGATPLTWATNPAMARKPQHAEIVGLLLKGGAKGKENALMSAVSAPDPAMVKIILDSGGLSPNTLSDALESATKDKRQDIIALLEQAGAKPYIEYKIDESQLNRYAGTYRPTEGAELVFKVTEGRLTGGSPGQPFSLVARDATTFRIVGLPGATLTFQLEEGKPAALTFSRGENKTNYTRVEGK